MYFAWPFDESQLSGNEPVAPHIHTHTRSAGSRSQQYRLPGTVPSSYESRLPFPKRQIVSSCRACKEPLRYSSVPNFSNRHHCRSLQNLTPGNKRLYIYSQFRRTFRCHKRESIARFGRREFYVWLIRLIRARANGRTESISPDEREESSD